MANRPMIDINKDDITRGAVISYLYRTPVESRDSTGRVTAILYLFTRICPGFRNATFVSSIASGSTAIWSVEIKIPPCWNCAVIRDAST